MEVSTRIIRRTPIHFCTGFLRVALLALIVMPLPMKAKEVILSIRQSGKEFQDAYSGLRNELRNDFDVKEHVIDKKCTAKEIGDLMRRERPKLVVLMDNSAITLFRKYQSTLSESDPVIPSISIMGIMIQAAIGDLKNATGISYEIPVITGVVNLRSVLSLPFKKVGVLHREYLNEFIAHNTVFCKREGIDLVSISLPNKSSSYKTLVKKALTSLSNEKVEGIWIPNDNALLQPDIIRSVWIPKVRRMKIPVIVGIEVLVNPALDFGTFAVLPDHVSLGNQAAEMVYDIMDNNWQCKNNQVDPPLAIFKIINLPQAKKLFNISEEKLSSVDKKLK